MDINSEVEVAPDDCPDTAFAGQDGLDWWANLVGRWSLPDNTALEGYCTALIQPLAGAAHHPAYLLALHVADLYVATATVAEQSNEDALRMDLFADRLPHLCASHIQAAVYLMLHFLQLRQPDPLSALDAGRRVVLSILATDWT